MMMTMRLCVLVLLGLGLAPLLRAQAPAPDPIRELLAEVKGLRAAIERSTATGARIQVFVARMQIQEQRLAELSRRIASVRSEVRSADSESIEIANTVARLDEALGRMSGDELTQAQQQIAIAKTRLKTVERHREELALEDARLAQDMAQEQGRWSAISDQLDQLDRALMSPQP